MLAACALLGIIVLSSIPNTFSTANNSSKLLLADFKVVAKIPGVSAWGGGISAHKDSMAFTTSDGAVVEGLADGRFFNLLS